MALPTGLRCHVRCVWACMYAQSWLGPKPAAAGRGYCIPYTRQASQAKLECERSTAAVMYSMIKGKISLLDEERVTSDLPRGNRHRTRGSHHDPISHDLLISARISSRLCESRFTHTETVCVQHRMSCERLVSTLDS